jgi:hypothetical protein
MNETWSKALKDKVFGAFVFVFSYSVGREVYVIYLVLSRGGFWALIRNARNRSKRRRKVNWGFPNQMTVKGNHFVYEYVRVHTFCADFRLK